MARMRFQLILNPANIDKIATGPEVRRFVGDNLGSRVVAQVKANAPTMGVPEYRKTIGKGPTEVEGNKVTVEVYSSDPFWHLVEFGSMNNPAHHPLEKGVTAAGIEFKASGR